MLDRINSFTVVSDGYRLEAPVQNHERTSSVKADTSNLTPLHTLRNPLQDIKHTHTHSRPVQLLSSDSDCDIWNVALSLQHRL